MSDDKIVLDPACQAARQQSARRIQGRDEATGSGHDAPHPETVKIGQIVLPAGQLLSNLADTGSKDGRPAQQKQRGTHHSVGKASVPALWLAESSCDACQQKRLDSLDRHDREQSL